MSALGEWGPSVAADGAEVEPCPSCETTSGVSQVITDTPPTVQAWSCAACGTEWAFTVLNLQVRPWLEQLAEDLAARAVLREVSTLAGHAGTLTPGQLRARLIGCLARLDRVCRHG